MDKPVVKQGQDQREALNDAERRAERERPQNYQQEETEDKIVEVLPIDGDSTPIQGIDPGSDRLKESRGR
jgi:hypothetical protein